MPSPVTSSRAATIGYVAPFAAFVGLLELEHLLSIPPVIFFPLRFAIVLTLLLTVARPYIQLRPAHPWSSIVIGIAVFLIWVGPDILFHYRHHWLFENSLLGSATSTMPPDLKATPWFLMIRAVSSFTLVPILEELFWRGWMMRYLIDAEFLKVPLGQYTRFSFWVVAVLFASEHGAFWEVGLAAGIIYNWWLIRCRNLADCILAHAVTNAVLAVYVVKADQWQYWL